ncbi:MAG TPA: substrate-binding domain-containing protein [Chthonomonadaceae bacterium]|nr:substrate-binding domain-containing protein [Chthonomonadaceae bacterium]
MESGLSNNLKSTRNRLGLSQQQLADAAGITRQTIGGIEAGQYAPSAAVALRLAKALGCRVEDLFWLEEDLPTIEARSAGTIPAGTRTRVTLAQVNGQWVAHPLIGLSAFRTEMVPADGLGDPKPGGEQVAVKLLDDPENLLRTVVIAGCTPALSLWARSAERWYPGLRVHWTHANSMAALDSLARGEVHAAGCHLYDPATGEYNTPFVRQALPGRTVILVNLGVWEEGFVVAPGNPKGIRHGADLTRADVVLVNREEGAGSRLLLDTLLSEEGVPVTAVQGYDRVVGSHQEIACAVSAGWADVGVSTAALAAVYGLSFVPLRRVRYDLALLEASLRHEPIRQLFGTLHHRWVRCQLEVLGGYDTSRTGEVVTQISSASPSAGAGAGNGKVAVEVEDWPR